MRVILAGTRSFGLAAYEMLLEEEHEVVGVWSPQGDKLTHRARRDHRWIWPNARTPKGVELLRADLFVAAHSHDFIGRESRGATRLGGIGYHPSLLPRHRGRDAVRWTIHCMDPIAGGSVYWLTDNVDGGPIAQQQHVHVRPGWDGSDLWEKELFPLGIRLLRGTLRHLDLGIMVEIDQDEKCATWEPSWERPPLFRPELPQLGGMNGMHHVTSRDT